MIDSSKRVHDMEFNLQSGNRIQDSAQGLDINIGCGFNKVAHVEIWVEDEHRPIMPQLTPKEKVIRDLEVLQGEIYDIEQLEVLQKTLSFLRIVPDDYL